MASLHQETWVLVSNTNCCRLYKYDKNPGHLTLLKELNHPENKLRDIDLVADRPGHYSSSGDARGAFTQPNDPKEIKIDDFSREIAKELDHCRNSYSKLIIIAPPRMDGLIHKHLNKHVDNLVSHDIKKDLMHLKEKELLAYLHENTQYPSH